MAGQSEQHGIVVVDDHDEIRRLLEILIDADPRLTHAGSAPDGRSGIELVAATSPAAVILDFEMPDVDGLEVLRTVRAAGSTAVVVLYTSESSAGPAALAQGADDAFDKGASLTEMLDRIVELVEGRASS